MFEINGVIYGVSLVIYMMIWAFGTFVMMSVPLLIALWPIRFFVRIVRKSIFYGDNIKS